MGGDYAEAKVLWGIHGGYCFAKYDEAGELSSAGLVPWLSVVY